MGFDPAKYIVKPQKQTRWSNELLGASGRGKTYQYRKCVEEGYKPIYISSEKKIGSLRDLDPDCIFITKPDYPMREEGAVAGNSDLFDTFSWLATGKHEYDLAFWDGPMRALEDLGTYLREVKSLSGQEFWGQLAEKGEKMVKKFISLTYPNMPKPIHVVATWGVEKEKDWTGVIGVQPLMDGQKFKPKIPYLFENILGVDRVMDPTTSEESFVMYTKPTKGMDCKISAGGVEFAAIIKNPSLGVILRTLEKGGEPIPAPL